MITKVFPSASKSIVIVERHITKVNFEFYDRHDKFEANLIIIVYHEEIEGKEKYITEVKVGDIFDSIQIIDDRNFDFWLVLTEQIEAALKKIAPQETTDNLVELEREIYTHMEKTIKAAGLDKNI